MSGRPNIPAIAELRQVASQLRTVCKELAQARIVATKIPQLEAQFESSKRRAIELLREMDCYSSGNTGYENRMASLLMGIDEIYLPKGSDAKIDE